ncbi:glycoside hydrolase family 73 protein [Lentilactobacillus diolivorans]|uniref:glycoside hydrolase family 73 protein n=1 Tax=Lentilactobacillus diolivorans TaxID=179838 RepID=UPI003CC814C1
MRKVIKCGLMAVVITGMGFLLSILPSSTYVRAQASTASSFITKYKSDVKKASTKYNLYGSVMMAQAGLESGWGQSELTQDANNFFGIKGAYNGQSVSMPTVEYNSNGQMTNTTANFKKYPTAYASFADNGSTLRNGTSWNTNYYSGTWKENAGDYAAAANALTGKYATAPNYGTSLIKIIETYSLDQIFGENGSDGSSSSSTATTDSSDSQDSASTSSNTNSSASTNQPDLTTGQTTKAAVSVNYSHGSGKDLVPLSAKYSKYYVYNHVKGSSQNEKRYSWTSLGVKNRVQVYLDMKATKQGTSGSWYRFRFYPTTKAKKFWVYAPALSFAKTYYGAASGKLVPSRTASGSLYTHILGSPTLSKQTTKLTSLKAKKHYSVNQTALQSTKSGPVLWYRLADGKTKGWIKGTNVLSFPSSIAMVNANGTKTISEAANSSYLYNNATTAITMQKHYKLAQVDLRAGTKVKVDKLGYKVKDKSLWYRIICPNTDTKYWISSKFLS